MMRPPRRVQFGTSEFGQKHPRWKVRLWRKAAVALDLNQ